jgi:hypothetical protein
MPQYAILLYAPMPDDPADVPPEELEAHLRYDERVKELGGRTGPAIALAASSTATTIRGDAVTDGPFLEAKEVLGGAFVLEARDLDHAIQIARECPATWRGSVEIRPLIGVRE